MKRLVTFIKEDNKNIVTSISAPLNENDLDISMFDENIYGLIDENFIEPIIPQNKKLIMYYNDETKMIDFEYLDIDFEDLSPADKIKILKEENANVKAENANIKAELELTQMALFELDWIINGGTEEEIPEEELPEENPEEDTPAENIPEEVPPTDVEIPVETPEEIPEDEIDFDLVAAIEDAEENTVIKLPKDVHLTEEISIKKAITIDLNGHNITSDKGVFIVRSVNGVLSIIGEGLVRGGSGDNYTAITVSTGKAYLEGGEYQVGGDADNLGNTTIYASGSGEIIIKGGTFSTDVPYNDKYYVLNRKNGSTSTIIVYGGLFYNYNPENGDDADGGNFIADGYKSVFNEEMQAWQVIVANIDNEVTKNNDNTVNVDTIDESNESIEENIEENEIISDTIETENIDENVEENDIIDENIEDTTLEADNNVNESLEESETSKTESNIDSNINEVDVSGEDLEASDEVSE